VSRGRADLAGLSGVRVVGSLLPSDLIGRLVTGTELPGMTPDDYRLELGVTPKEAANRAWSVLSSAWKGYREALSARPGDAATALTREKWLGPLLRELGYGRVPVTPAGGLHADGRSFAVSHRWQHVPVHLLGSAVPLDQRTAGMPGAADKAPHAMVQELLNRSDDHLWAVLANGETLRLLRDSSALVGQSFVEFDLQAIFDGELFSDFVVLFLLCHQSRLEALSDGGPSDCWLERWRSFAAETGARALGALRLGVKDALEQLGTGFLRHPDNAALRARLDAGGDLSLADYHRALLRLVYRLLFCFVAEDRGLLLDPAASDQARVRYGSWFSTARLRRVASRRHGTRHADLWAALSLVLQGLGSDDGLPDLALPALGGIFETGPADVVEGCSLGNDALLAAVRSLSVVTVDRGGPRRAVNYRDLGAEELGGIYEGLLEFIPRYDPIDRRFTLEVLSGSERKTSGSYYTPTSLIDCLLDSALDPLLDEAEKQTDPQAALLALTVCDPACGSGHFLVAAARRVASRLARVRAEGAEPTLLDAQAAMHDVVARCIYGVDLNPLAAELAKVSLWLEALQPGRPLSFLDAHVKVGNALLGTTPELLAGGIPDEAFTALEGDDKATATKLKKQNKRERDSQQGELMGAAEVRALNVDLVEEARRIDELAGLSLGDVHLARQRQRELDELPERRRAVAIADAWCSAFVIEKRPDVPAITTAVLDRWASQDVATTVTSHEHAAVRAISARYRWFHWQLEFPQIFGPDTPRGFSCVVGNPPWERIKLAEQEFFASRDADIALAPNAAARKRLIKQLAEKNPPLLAEFEAAKRQADGESQFIRMSGRYPLCGRGDINTYAVFAETDRSLIAGMGRLGVILPTGIATDATTQHFFRSLVTSRSLVSLYDFENRKLLFQAVDSRMKFCLLTLAGQGEQVSVADFAFFATEPADLQRPDARFALSPEEILLLNPNTGTCPVFRSRRDAEITLGIYRRLPVLFNKTCSDGNPWEISFSTMFHMSNDSALFRTADELEDDGWKLDGNVYRKGKGEMLPLYEAKMVHHFDHRWATYDGTDTRDVTATEHDNADCVAIPRYWVAGKEVDDRTAGRWGRDWLLGFRDITNATNERTMVAAAFPRSAVGNNLPLLLPTAEPAWCLATTYATFAFDFPARLSVGGTHMNFFIAEQLPVPAPGIFEQPAPWHRSATIADWLRSRVLELTYTAWDMQPFAGELGDDGPPFRWDDGRRAALRAELDAAFFHLYGIGRDDAAYILGTFPIVHRNDLTRHGEERTRRLVLAAYDALAAAETAQTDFVSTLDPPPGLGPRHPEKRPR
jgi:hypothetical protein